MRRDSRRPGMMTQPSRCQQGHAEWPQRLGNADTTRPFPLNTFDDDPLFLSVEESERKRCVMTNNLTATSDETLDDEFCNTDSHHRRTLRLSVRCVAASFRWRRRKGLCRASEESQHSFSSHPLRYLCKAGREMCESVAVGSWKRCEALEL